MKLKVPPVLVLIFFGLLMYVLALILPVGYFDFFGRKYLVHVLLILAGVIGLISLLQFFRSKTTIDPRTPSKASILVTGGLYKYSRNPMYLGMLLLILAWVFG